MSQRARLGQEITDLLYATLPSVLAINALVAVIVLAAVWSVVPATHLAGWAALMAIVLVARATLLSARRTQESIESDSTPWLRRFRFHVATTAIAWGGAALLLLPAGSLADHPVHWAFICMVLIGLGTGAAFTLAVDLPSTLCYLIPLVIPITTRFVAEASDTSYTLAALSALFLGYVSANSARVRRTLIDNIRLRIEANAGQASLRESEQALNRAQQIARIGSFDWNPVSGELHWTDEHFRLWGLAPGCQTPDYALFRGGVHAEDIERVEQLLGQALRGAGVYDCEHRVCWPDGTLRHCRGRGEVTFDAEGRAVRMIGTVLDITDLKQTEAALKQSLDNLQQTLESTDDGIFAYDGKDPTGRLLFANRQFFSIWRIPPEDAAATGRPEIMAAAAKLWFDNEKEVARVQATLNLDHPVEDKVQLRDGRTLFRRSIPILGDRGVSRIWSFRDITAEERILAVTRASEAEQRALLGAFPGVIARTDEHLTVTYANDRLATRLKMTAEGIVGRSLGELLGAERATAVAARLADTASPGELFLEWRHADGGETEIDRITLASGIDPATGTVAHYLFGIDISALKRTEDALRESERLLADQNLRLEELVAARTRELSTALIAAQAAEEGLRIAAVAFDSNEGMLVTDAEANILRVNAAFTAITGYAANEVIGHNPRIFQSGRHEPDFYRDMWESITRTGGWSGEIWDRRKNGEIYPKWLTITAVRDAAGKVTHYVGSHTDITQRKQSEERIRELAYFDQLTGLPNRTLLQDRLRQTLTASSRSGSYNGLLFIDLDHFKTLNDALGHDYGDLLLREVARRLTESVRAEDTVARLGGDEFVVLLAHLGTLESGAAAHAETVGEKVLAALNRPYLLKTSSHHNTPSIGITLFRGGATSAEEVMKQADLAMYKAKATGRNALRFFDPELEVAVQRRSEMEAGLRAAVGSGAFILHYQPQVDSGGRIIGAEALVRWRHPERGMVSPLEFIALAEDTGLIQPLGQWVLETACRQLRAWAGIPGLAELTIAVNISARQIREPGFVDQVLATIARAEANPARLRLELTESLLVDKIDEIVAKMHALKGRGIGFALDDFGTGYSSLSYLKRLPLDELKIDQSFVRDVLVDPNDAAIARTIVALAESLGLGVIAEGVESEAQRAFLERSGCHAYQGYLYSRPLTAEAFLEFALAPVE